MNFKSKLLAFASMAILISGCSAPTGSSVSNLTSGTGNDKASFVKFLNCSLDNSKNEADKKAIQSVLSIVNLIPDIAWQNAKGAYDQYYKMFEKYCTSLGSTPTASPSPVASATPINLTDKVSEGMTKHSCDKEGTLKSASGKALNLNFVNNSGKNIKIYWLDFSGKRVVYNPSLANGQNHKQGTFVTHPWLITDENDKCLQIYLPETEKSDSIEINNF